MVRNRSGHWVRGLYRPGRSAVRKLLAVSAVALLSLLVPGAASAAPPGGPEARGNGTSTGDFEHFSFSARGTLFDADGSIRATDGDTSPNTTVNGEVNCLNVIGNDAYLSGIITDVKPDSLFLTQFYAHAEDNGGPGGGKNSLDPPDRFDIFVRGTSFVLDCTTVLELGQPLQRGDVRVDAGS
jgi:hypothetical protein